MDAGRSSREAFYAHLREIESLYEVSGVQSVAVNAYINAILSTGLRFAGSGLPARGMVLTAVVDLIRNLVLFGFSCFRMLATDPDGDGNLPIQIPSGASMPVRFSSKRLRWVPDFMSNRSGSGLEIFEPTAEGAESSDEDEEDDPFRWRASDLFLEAVVNFCLPIGLFLGRSLSGCPRQKRGAPHLRHRRTRIRSALRSCIK